jgi:hypothetical protein
MAEPRSPPLWCLPAAVAIAAAITLPFIISFLGHEDRLAELRHAFQGERVRAFAAGRAADDIVVVGIGTSLLKYAIEDGERFTATAAAAGVAQARYLRLTTPGAVMPIPEQLQDELLRLRPDVLVVHDHALFYSKERSLDDIEAEGVREYVRSWWRTTRRWLRGKAPEPITAARLAAHEDRFDCDLPTHDEATIEQFRRKRAGRHQPGPSASLLRTIERCRSLGTRVVIVPMPVDPRWQRVYADHADEIARRSQELVERGLFELHVCPLAFTTDDYIDLRHMKPPARQRFTAWLMGSISTGSSR